MFLGAYALGLSFGRQLGYWECWPSAVSYLECHGDLGCRLIWGFPKIRGTILGFPIIRTIVY